MGEEPKTEMSEDARGNLVDALRDAVLDVEDTGMVRKECDNILADIDNNLQVSIENARLRQQVEQMTTDIKTMKKDLKVQKMLRGKAEAKAKRMGEKSDEEGDDAKEEETEKEPEPEDEGDSFFDEPDSSSMEVVKGIILQECDGGGWASIQVVRDEASLLDIEPDDVDAIIDYWMNDESVDIEKDETNVRIKE